MQSLYAAADNQCVMAHGIGFALVGMSIELWAVMMAALGGGGVLAFIAGTIGLGIGIGGGLMAEAAWTARPVRSSE